MRCVFLLAFTLSALSAQTQPPYSGFVTGSNYTAPPQLSVAPGHIVTFFVAGLSQANAAAITASISTINTPIAVLSAKPVDVSTLAITVQVPFILPVSTAISPEWFVETLGSIQFCQQTACTAPTTLQYTPAIPHVISTCDIFYSDAAFGSCQLAIFHQNGQYVSNTAPAAPGEILTLWALGLGLPSTGYSATTTAPIPMNDVILQAEYPATAGNSSQFADIPYQFAGLPSATVGLYQINFAVPAPPPGLLACGSHPSPSGVPNDGTQLGNLAIGVGRNVTAANSLYSTTTVYYRAICVATP